MKIKTILFPLFAAVLLAVSGCTSPTRYVDGAMIRLDKDTEYHVEDFDGGFVLTVEYSRYQSVSESDAVDSAAMSQMLSLAYDIAERRGKSIKPVNEQRIRKSMGRNDFTGITSWSGTVKVVYDDV